MFKKILFFVLIIQFSYSQNRELIQGKVIYRNIDVPAANVINNTAQSSTITNDQGEFEIYAKEGDEIIFSSVQYIIRTVRVNKEILENKRLIVQINQRVRELDEVVITPDDTQKFLDLKEEQFKGFDYIADKSTKIQNVLTDNRQVVNGLNFVNIFKLLSSIVDAKSDEEKLNIIPSEVSICFGRKLFSGVWTWILWNKWFLVKARFRHGDEKFNIRKESIFNNRLFVK